MTAISYSLILGNHITRKNVGIALRCFYSFIPSGCRNVHRQWENDFYWQKRQSNVSTLTKSLEYSLYLMPYVEMRVGWMTDLRGMRSERRFWRWTRVRWYDLSTANSSLQNFISHILITLSLRIMSKSICVPSSLSESPLTDHEDWVDDTPKMPNAVLIWAICDRHTSSNAKPRHAITCGDIWLTDQKPSSRRLVPFTKRR